MPTRLKQARSRKSGHKHSLNAQDYTSGHWTPARIAKSNLDTALAMLQSKPVKEVLGYHPALASALSEIGVLVRLLGE